MWNTTKEFYNSTEWITTRLNIIAERNSICEECKKLIVNDKDLHVHHIKEITTLNVNDYNISLNPNNLKVLCHDCHDKAHKRFKYKTNDKGIYIVYGAPCSGKTTYVMENKTDSDLVIDLDRLYEAVTLLPRYHKPDALKYNVFAIKNTLIDNIKVRYGSFNRAWIVGGYSNKHDREKLARDLGAELIHIDTDKDECIRRLEGCVDYRKNNKKEWVGYINKWFDEFVE